MPQWCALTVGILMILAGLYVLLARMPVLKRNLAQRHRAGERTPTEVRREMKHFLAITLWFLIAGGGLIGLCVLIWVL